MSEMLNPPEENVGSTLQNRSIGRDFLNKTPFAMDLRQTINKWDPINLKGISVLLGNN